MCKKTRVDIVSLSKDPSHSEPSQTLENVETGTRPAKSVRYKDDLDTVAEINEDLDLTTIPYID